MTRAAEAQRQIALERLAEFRRREAEKMAKAEAAKAAVEATAAADGADHEPPPVLRGYIWRHKGEFAAVDDTSPCLPARGRIFLRLGGCFTGAVVLEQSANRGQAWSPMKWNDGGGQVVLATPGVVCVGTIGANDLVLARARCMSLSAGKMVWSISTW